jgi:hypothetical protein
MRHYRLNRMCTMLDELWELILSTTRRILPVLAWLRHLHFATRMLCVICTLSTCVCTCILCEQSYRSKSSCTASIPGLRRKGALFSRGTLSGGEFELSTVSGYRGALDIGEHSAGLFRNTGRISETRQCGLICPLEERRGGEAGGADLVISMFSACLSVSEFATHRHTAFARFVLEVVALLVFYLRCLEYGVTGLLCLSKERNDPYSTAYIHGAIPFLHAPLGRQNLF